jgi:hypothetical protein
MQKAMRNDRRLKQNKFRVLITNGAKNAPEGYQRIPDAGEDEDDK